MSAISKRLREIYESEDGPNILSIAANELERIEAELAEANAKIKAVRALHWSSEEPYQALCEGCEEYLPCPTIRAVLESAAPKPPR